MRHQYIGKSPERAARKRNSPAAILIAASLTLAIASATQAGWNVINLHPAGHVESQASSIRATQQVGGVDFYTGSGDSHAALWTGSAGSFVDLGSGYAAATDGFQQVGTTGQVHAALWSGSAGSLVDLQPTALGNGMQNSYAQAVFAGVQVGYTIPISNNLLQYAALWSGSAASWVNLHPANAVGSIAEGEYIGQEVGVIQTPSALTHAGVWYGTAASFVDINPAGADQSFGYGVYNGKQVGWAELTGQTVHHASLWSNTAASWVDLNPAGASASEAYFLNNSEIAGVATVGGVQHASFWNGSAASWEDLHAYLPAGFSSSVATGLWLDNQGLAHICGYALNTATGYNQAVIWVQSVPEPTSVSTMVIAALTIASRRRRAIGK